MSNFLKNKNLNYEKAQSLINNTLIDCDDGELYLEDTKSESILLDDNKIKSSSFTRDTGYGLRGVTEDKVAYSHSNDISEKSLEMSCDNIKSVSYTHLTLPTMYTV